MVVERGDAKNFFPVSEFLGSELDDDRTDLEDIDSGDDDENRESVRHHCHDSEVGSECERTDIAHIELRGFYVEPEKCDERSDDEHADGREDEKTLRIGDESVHDIVEEEESSRESVESVRDIHGICHRDDDEDKEGNIENPETHFAEEGEVESGMPEFHIEPVRSKSCKYREEYHLDPCGKSLRSSDSANIQIVVHEADESDRCERKECEISFVSIPETVFYSDSEEILNIRREEVYDYGECDEREYGEEDDSRTHRGSSSLVFMKFRKLGRFPHKRFLANLLPEFILMKEPYIRGNEEESQKE